MPCDAGAAQAVCRVLEANHLLFLLQIPHHGSARVGAGAQDVRHNPIPGTGQDLRSLVLVGTGWLVNLRLRRVVDVQDIDLGVGAAGGHEVTLQRVELDAVDGSLVDLTRVNQTLVSTSRVDDLAGIPKAENSILKTTCNNAKGVHARVHTHFAPRYCGEPAPTLWSNGSLHVHVSAIPAKVKGHEIQSGVRTRAAQSPGC
mmetsp:Transcript_71030/g.114554  ORF Transcript_71030/g.114554 Transcript_71030/m.114554 type:complete len:201 (+) Transcript_71030:678-1280(+)